MALKLGDYVVTEAGFGADLGAEKFLRHQVPHGWPHARTPCVVVATVRALKHNGGVAKAELTEENLEALEAGHAQPAAPRAPTSRASAACPWWWPSTAFPTDTAAELALVADRVQRAGRQRGPLRGLGQGRRGRPRPGRGGPAPLRTSRPTSASAYELDEPHAPRRSRPLPRRVYHADGVDFAPKASAHAATARGASGFGGLPVCMAKTQYSFSDDATKLLGAPRGLPHHRARACACSAGAGFVVALTGDIMTMPGLPQASPPPRRSTSTPERPHHRPVLVEKKGQSLFLIPVSKRFGVTCFLKPVLPA